MLVISKRMKIQECFILLRTYQKLIKTIVAILIQSLDFNFEKKKTFSNLKTLFEFIFKS